MTDKKSRQRDSLGNKRESLPHGGVSTETIDLESLFPKDVTDSGSFEIQGEIWTTTFGRVIQALPIPVWLIDESRNVIAANQACRKIGAGHEMMVGKPFSRLFPNQPDALQSESLVSTVFSTRKTSVWEALLKIGKNSMWGRLTFRAIRMRDQRCLMVLVEDLSPEKKQHLLDKKYKDELEKRVKERTEQLRKLNDELHCEIADRKRSEEALRRSEERFRQIAESTGEWIWEVDAEGTYRYCSSAVESILGYSPAELVGKKHFYDLFAPEVRKSLKETVLSAFERREQFRNLVNPNVHKNAEIRILEASGSPIRDNEGNLLGYLGADKDITDREKAEEALRESEKRYRMLFESAGDCVYILDAEGEQPGQIVSANPAAAKMHGYTVEEMLSLNIADLDSPESARNVQARIERLLKGETVKEEVTHRRKDGSVFSLDINAQLLVIGGHKYILATDRDITERKGAEEALRLSEERYRRLFEDAPLIYVITRNEGGVPLISDCNELFLHSVGYARREVQGKPLADFYSPGSRSELLKRGGYARALAGEFLIGERELVRRDGTLIPTLLYTAPEVDSSGQVTGTRAMFVDITERRKTEKALNENERRLSTLMFNLPGMAYRCINDPEWTMEYVSEGCSTLTGYSPKHLVGNRTLSYADLIHPEDQGRVWDQVQEALTAAAPFELEYRIRTRSGHEKWVWERGIGVPLEGAGEIKLEGFVWDVTERKQMEHALQESEQRYRAVVENLQIGISVINPRMEIIAINRFFQKIYPHVQPGLGQHCYEIYNDPAGTSPCSYCPCVKTFQDGMVHESVTETPAGDRIRNYRIVSCPIKDAQGHVELVVELVEDVTERRALQLQLAQAQKMEAVGTLAGGIAHDFNNLLTVVMGFSELLRAEKEQDDPEYADLSKILQSARSGAELVQRLLTFSRKVEPKPVPLNLNIRIVQVGKLLRRTIPKMIEIQMDLSEDLAEINADPTQMEQILMNLCVNARDAMPDGGKLTLGTKNVTLDEEYCGIHSEAKPGSYVLLAVSDTGHGMDRATIDHIFEPFYTTKELGRGTGLGLAMVYGIVKQHGGYITCYSEVERGATFNVYFPALESQVEPDEEKAPVMPPFGTETVLLVDDEDLVRDLGARILSKAGYQVITATNGKDALALFEKERRQLSLVILDLIMPVMGGKECLKELLKIDPQMKVLIASGFSADASTDETLELGAKAFVSKPFRFQELLRQVRKTLDQR